MPYSILFLLIVLLLAVALVGTIWVGHSKENREGNPDYERKTGRNITRLTMYYILATVLGVVAFIGFMMSI